MAIELNGFEIKYQARTAIKGQVLVDIFAACTHNPELKKDTRRMIKKCRGWGWSCLDFPRGENHRIRFEIPV